MMDNNQYQIFPCGFFCKNFFTSEYCDLLREELNDSTWIPALIGKYDGNDYLGNEHDPNISTALVTLNFRFSKELFKPVDLHKRIHNLIVERFKISPDKFSDYGISRYPVGSKLSVHADTGVYNTKRLVTCVH